MVNNTLLGLLNSISQLLSAVVPIIIGLALVVFLWGVLSYVISKGADDKEKARGFMIWGIVGLFVMVSVWGIVNVLATSVFPRGSGINPLAPAGIPTIPTRTGGNPVGGTVIPGSGTIVLPSGVNPTLIP